MSQLHPKKILRYIFYSIHPCVQIYHASHLCSQRSRGVTGIRLAVQSNVPRGRARQGMHKE
jgi:hypothetical protein